MGKSNGKHKVSQVKGSRDLQLLIWLTQRVGSQSDVNQKRAFNVEDGKPVHTTHGSALNPAHLILKDFIAY